MRKYTEHSIEIHPSEITFLERRYVGNKEVSLRGASTMFGDVLEDPNIADKDAHIDTVLDEVVEQAKRWWREYKEAPDAP